MHEASHCVSCGDDGGYHVPQSGPATAWCCSFCGGCGARGEWPCRQQPWRLAKHSKVLSDVEVIPSVWSLQCKRDVTTNKIKKYKARLNLHGGKQVFGLNYYETYAPVVTWFSIRLLLGSSSAGLYVKWTSPCHRPWHCGGKHILLNVTIWKTPIADVRFNLKSKPDLQISRDLRSK